MALKRVKITFSLIILVTFVTAMNAGCGGNERDHSNYMTAEKANQEYREAARQWDLAPGSVWPTDPFLDRLHDGREASYEKGSGVIDASFDWWCSWVLALTRERTAEERKTAENHVLRIRETPFYQQLIPEDREAFDKDVVEPAVVGEFSGAMAVAEINCT